MSRSTKVVTWMSANSQYVNLTEAQSKKLQAANCELRDSRGATYAQVSKGLHVGSPDYTDAEIDAIIAAK